MRTNIWWIRRDLRLYDNPVLANSIINGDQIIPLFLLDHAILDSAKTGIKRNAFLFEALTSLDKELKARGAKLIIKSGEPVQVFSEIMAAFSESDRINIYCEEDFTPYAQRRDTHVSQYFPLIKSSTPAILPPGIVQKKDKTPYTIFTPYKNAWNSIASLSNYQPIQAPGRINIPPNIESLPIPKVVWQSSTIAASENAAQTRLEWMISGKDAPIFNYAENRNIPSLDGTSRLSPYLRFGILSPKYVFSRAHDLINQLDNVDKIANVKIWLNELVWRDFYMQILSFFPQVAKENFRHKHIQWLNDNNTYRTWCNGQTGFPIIDAAMRQLVETGWLHNRLRMIVASFLTKNLLIDWRWGEQFFMQHLIDGDPAANNGGWQWCASTGTDAVPYFRIFNPVTQSKKYDANGIFIRTWLPELSNVKNKYIHEPWLMPLDEQDRCNCHISKEYPFPIVDLNKSRYRALNAFIDYS